MLPACTKRFIPSISIYKGIIFRLLLLLVLVCIQLTSYTQCNGVNGNCAVCGVTASIISIGGGDIDVGTSVIPGDVQAGDNTVAPNPLVVTANSCGVIELVVELDFNWDQGDQANWIHGISFSSSDGWDAAIGIPPSDDWLFLDTIIGCCSNNGYGAGYYFETPGTGGTSNCCGVGDTPNNPENNYGINCTTGCPEFQFSLSFCPDTIGTANEIISFFITEDGETGGWNSSDGCIFLLNFPITIESAGATLPDSIGPICEGECTILDAGTGCTTYLWSTGEDTPQIEVCPTENTSYSVTATGEGGCVITGEVKVLVEPCCAAEAGELTADPQPACPGSLVTVEANNFQDSLPFEQYMLVVDANGLVIETIMGSSIDVSLDSCGTLIVYSYNFLTAGNSPIPVIGLDVSTIDCELNCCDLEMIPVSFEDNELPTAIDPPEDLTLECIDLLNPIQDLEFEDNCDPSDFSIGTEDGVADLCNGGVITRTWEYEDACGNLGMHIQTITIQAPPVGEYVDPPGDESIACANIPTSAPDLVVTNNASGACLFEETISPTLSGTADACGGEIIFTWEYTDPCTNVITHVQTYTVEPASEPAFLNIPPDLTVTCDNIPTGATDLLYTNSEMGVCLIEGIISPTTDSNVNTCGGEITNTWIFTDACDRTIEHIQTITVEPRPAADFINIPADITVSCDNAPSGIPPELTYTNNENGACEISGTVAGEVNGEFNLCGGTLIYRWTFVDDCDREINAQQTITIEPAPDPMFVNLPVDITVNCENLPGAPPTLAYTNNGSGSCLITGDAEPSISGTVDACGGQISYTWTFEEDCFSISHTQNITVEPAPMAVFVSTPADITVDCENIPGVPQLAYSNNLSGDCEIDGFIAASTSGQVNGCGGQLINTWTFIDDCGRALEHMQIVTVEPASAAAFVDPPEDITISCNEVTVDPPFLDYTNNANGDCEIAGNVEALQSGTYDACGGTITYVWNFSDPCGRNINHTQTVTIEAAPPAVFLELPEDMTIDCGSPFPDPIDLEYSNDANDLCEIAGFVSAEIEVNGNVSVYTWNFINPCTNEELSHQQTLTISQEPDIVVDQAMFEFCEGFIFDLESIEVTDLNGTNPTITFHDDSPADASNEINNTELYLLIDRTVYILASNDFGCADELEINFAIEVPPFVGEDEFHFICFEDLLPVNLFEYIDPFADLDGTWIDVDGSGVDISDPFFVDFSNHAGNTFNYDYVVESTGICPNDTMRLELTLVPEVQAEITEIMCMADPNFYEINVTANGNAVETTIGNIVDQGNGFYMVVDIPITESVTISVGDPATLCYKDFEISPPNCDCPSVDPPVSNGDQRICQGETILELGVTVGPDITANWYTTSTGGTPFLSMSLIFTPDVEMPGTYTYYVESESLTDPGCVSLIRTPIELIIDGNPIVDNASLNLCDFDGNGEEAFTLSEAEAEISIDPSLNYSYHLTIDDANNNQNALSIPFTNTMTPQVLFVRVSNPQGCYSIAELTLNIDPVIQIELEEMPAQCTGQQNGSLMINISGEPDGWEFSIDNMIWQTDSSFNALAPANYILYARNLSCSFETPFIIGAGLDVVLASFEANCNDNNTETDPLDDFYEINFTVNSNLSGEHFYRVYNASQDYGIFQYGQAESFTIPANGQNYNLTFEDDSLACFVRQEIGPLNPCSTNCELEVLQLDVVCESANTPTDPEDDFYTITLNANSINGGATYNVFIDGLLSFNYNFNEMQSFTLPANGDSPTILLVDSQDDQCFVSQIIGPLNPCSNLCVISVDVENVICNDQGTVEDAADDTYTFDISVQGMNTSSMWQITDLSLTGDFNSSTNLGPFLIADGGVSLRIQDINDPNCFTIIDIVAPPSCSETCVIELINFTESECSNNGTNNTDADDTFDLEFRIDKIEGANSLYNIDISGPDMFSELQNDLEYGEVINVTGLPANGQTLTVVVTDANNSSCTLTFEISQSPCSECNQTIDAGTGGTITCTNAEVNLSGIGPGNITYQWSGPNNFRSDELNTTVSFPGWYILTATFEDQCMAQDSVEVTIDESVPMVNAGPDLALTCNIRTLTLDGSQSSSNQSTIFIWRDADGNVISNENQITVDAVGVYSLELVDTVSDCSSGLDLVNVTEDVDGPSAIIYLNPGNQIDCIIDKITLSTENETNVLYTWTIDNETYTTSTVDVSSGGEVELVAIDTITGCSNSTIELIEDLETYPIIRIDEVPTLTCMSTEGVIDASGSQSGASILYQWYSPRDVALQGETMEIITVQEGGIYYLELIDTLNGCTNFDSVLVMEDLNFPEITSLEDVYLDCDETEAILVLGLLADPANYEIEWTTSNGNILNGLNTISPLVDAVGTYIVEIFDPISGCLTRDSAIVQGNPNGPELAFLQIDSISCENDNNGMLNVTEVEGGTPPFTYILNGNRTNPDGFFDNLSAGSYQLSIVDDNGCEYDTSFILSEGISLDINLEPTIILSRGDTTTIEAMVNYPLDRIISVQWTPEDGLACPTCLITQLTALFPTQYSVTVTNDLGCVSFANFRLIIERDINVYIPNVFSPNGDNINDLFTVFADETIIKVNKMMIFDRWGEKVFYKEDFQPNDIQAGWNGQLNGQPLNPAVFVYVIELELDTGEVGLYSGDITLIK